MSEERVLITGGGGVIGRAAVRALLEVGFSARLVDKVPLEKFSALAPDIASSAEYIEGHTCDARLIHKVTRNCDFVVHLAAAPSLLMYERDPIVCTGEAILGFRTVLDCAVRSGCSRVVYASTSAVYAGNPSPYREDLTVHPRDLKAAAKLANEKMARIYTERYGITTVGLRPFSVYGRDEWPKGSYSNVVSLFCWAMQCGERPLVWGDGAQGRDFVFVDDVAQAVLRAHAINPPTGQCIYNVGTGAEVSFLDLIAQINAVLGTDTVPIHVDVPIPFYPRHLQADTSSARLELGFKAQWSLSRGIEAVIEAADELDWSARRALAELHRKSTEVVQDAAAAHRSGRRHARKVPCLY